MFKAGDSKNKVCIVERYDGRLQINPCGKDKQERFMHYNAAPADMNGAREGDIVLVEHVAGTTHQVKVKRVLGQQNSPGILSLISACEKGLSDIFSQAAMAEAKAMSLPDLQGREDLRAVPLVTIDGADSRDFDDAVFAEKTPDGGFHLIVAIADVSWYVKPGSALDKDALERGNSTYFPDRVLPMLPEELSNGLCSLKPGEDRACMAFHLWIDKDGKLTDQKVVRGLMRSAARLTYKQVQAAKDGQPDALTGPLMDNVINPLYAAYAVLRKAREARGAMELDLPEYKVSIGSKGEAANVGQTTRPESCKVIEEFMVLANVAAATALESKQAPCVYRVHDRPPYMSSDNPLHSNELREYIAGFGLYLPEGEIKTAAPFNEVIKKAAQMPNGHLVIKAIMRAQAKANYDTQNIGHFGLALERYAHFTSPIRRYADLLVHRSLTEAFNLGPGALDSTQKAQLTEMAQHINETEKLSAKAERSAHDRLAAKYLSTHVGETFTGRIASVTNAGLFIRMDKSGSDGLLPMNSLPKDGYYKLDKAQHTLTGDSGRVYRTGASITVRLREADALRGSVLLAAANDNGADIQVKPTTGPLDWQKRRNGNKPGL